MLSADLRVVHVSHTSHQGGAELALSRLLGHNRGWTASVCAPPGGDAFASLADRGVPVSAELPGLPTGGTRSRDPMLAARYLLALKANARALRRSPLYRNADLVHANSAAAGIISALAGRGSAKPLVIHLRDLVEPDSLGRFGYLAFTRIALPNADGVIANSHSTLRSAMARLSPRTSSTVIQSPIGLSELITRPRVSQHVHRVGMLGRLQRWKGQDVFLRAFAQCFRGSPVTAVIAGAPLFGEEQYATQLRQLAGELGISEQVGFVGHVQDVPGFLDSVDVLVHASTRPEPLGQTVVQGLAYAKPVIATEGGGPSEWISNGTNGMLVPPGDPEALASALRTLADSYEMRVKLADAASHTPGILTDQECADAHAEYFQRIWLGRRAPE